jgi:hypothetical protein
LFLTLCIPIFPTDFKSDLWQTIECTIYSLFRRWTQVLSAMQHLAENWMDGSQFLFQLFADAGMEQVTLHQVGTKSRHI